MSTKSGSRTGQYAGIAVSTRTKGQARVVKRIQRQLRRRGYDPGAVNGRFGPPTKAALRLYQAQHVDQLAQPLNVDGIVGPLTWSSLFGMRRVPRRRQIDPLSAQALATSISQLGVLEDPLESNRGPEVDQYLLSVGIEPDQGTVDERFWCAAFVYWCFMKASDALGSANPVECTASATALWSNAPNTSRLTRRELIANPNLVEPGMVFVHSYGNGHGHTGIVKQSVAGRLVTIEGNVNISASRKCEGVGVYEITRRSICDNELLGLIKY